MNQYIETCIAEQEFATAITLCEYCLKEMTMEQYYQEGINEWLDDKKEGKNAFVRGLDWVIKALPRAIRALIRAIKGLFSKNKQKTAKQVKQETEGLSREEAEQIMNLLEHLDELNSNQSNTKSAENPVPEQISEPEQKIEDKKTKSVSSIETPRSERQVLTKKEKKKMRNDDKYKHFSIGVTSKSPLQSKLRDIIITKHNQLLKLLSDHNIKISPTGIDKMIEQMVTNKKMLILFDTSTFMKTVDKMYDAIQTVEQLTSLDLTNNPIGIIDKSARVLEKACKTFRRYMDEYVDSFGHGHPVSLEGVYNSESEGFLNLEYMSPDEYIKFQNAIDQKFRYVEQKCGEILESFDKNGSFFNNLRNKAYKKDAEKAAKQDGLVFDREKHKTHFEFNNVHAKNKKIIENSVYIFKLSNEYIGDARKNLDLTDSLNQELLGIVKTIKQADHMRQAQNIDRGFIDTTRSNRTVPVGGLFQTEDPGLNRKAGDYNNRFAKKDKNYHKKYQVD